MATLFHNRHRASRALKNSVVFGLCLLLVFGPVAFGAVEYWSTFVLQAGAALLFLLWTARQLLDGEAVLKWNALYPPALAFALLVIVQLGLSRSAYNYATQAEALRYGIYAAFLFLIVQSVESEQDLRIIFSTLLLFGFLFALFAVVQDFTSNGKLYWIRQPRSGGSLYGSYVNKNHYAGLMEMLAPIPLVLCLTRYLRGSLRVLAGFMAVVMVSSIFLSLSRGGMLAIAIQGLFLAFLELRERRRKGAMILVALGAVTIGMLLWTDTGRVASRIATLADPLEDSVPQMRLRVLQDSWPMLAERPILGWGLGTFPTVYPRFRTFYTNKFVNHAHNDYLEVLIDTGILGLAATFWFVVVLYRTGLRKLAHWRGSVRGSAALAALLGCTGILVHSFFDFNLHIPANAALFFSLCALATIEVRSAREAGGAAKESSSPPLPAVATIPA